MAFETRPVVSIVMPAYNAGQFIVDAITSVLSQTYEAWELLVVDDASVDNTAALVEAFQQDDPRIQYRRNSTNMGVVHSRNCALAMASGQYVAFLDADDVWAPFKLERQVSFMQETGVPISYGDYFRIDGDGRVVGKVLAPRVLRYEDMLRSNFIGNLTGIFRRADLVSLKFEDIKHEDYLFWLRALERSGVARATPSSEPLAKYRVSASSLSANKLKAARWQWGIYRSGLGLSVFRSAFFFLCYAWHAVMKRGVWRKLNHD
ncbi:glycosyltransferase family 2 protein [Achromobacter kerstersii]|uniref:UDP-Glc:alpha-D-GlcNAc-diphosphoundecaprenol beta-1,3-glucosyltransferase WfgD n=1 Tax=Achromobacter kerstersii TaxID=1353890 RepID=A0A6S7A519_9BURK|nr:glycosyltransferase family 2 protein [Achromobacter kerstersii]CAB3713647.1 UDP-Glc:alpha-D-GlcNAc-diphosphoundecaprenol beta-1,3-glucosyltransferase WfgD [Achromobacter kerstersii]